MMQTFELTDWLENFRMGKETFFYLCDELRPSISRQNTTFRNAISTERRVAITLWCLATPAEYRTIAHLFGVSRAAVCLITHTHTPPSAPTFFMHLHFARDGL